MHDDIRASYDLVAEAYSVANSTHGPIERAMLAVLAELADGPIADVGCGPGAITAHLIDLGADAFGIDLSPGMVAVARTSWPGIRFEVGSMEALDAPDAALGGIVAYYSIIHTPPQELPAIFAEFARALRVGGPALLAFQVGDEKLHIEHGYGHDLSVDAWRLRPEFVVGLLEDAGFERVSLSIREPQEGEKTQQALVLVRRGARP